LVAAVVGPTHDRVHRVAAVTVAAAPSSIRLENGPSGHFRLRRCAHWPSRRSKRFAIEADGSPLRSSTRGTTCLSAATSSTSSARSSAPTAPHGASDAPSDDGPRCAATGPGSSHRTVPHRTAPHPIQGISIARCHATSASIDRRPSGVCNGKAGTAMAEAGPIRCFFFHCRRRGPHATPPAMRRFRVLLDRVSGVVRGGVDLPPSNKPSRRGDRVLMPPPEGRRRRHDASRRRGMAWPSVDPLTSSVSHSSANTRWWGPAGVPMVLEGQSFLRILCLSLG